MKEKKLLLKQKLDKNLNIAFIFSPFLGDSLINMVTVYNLRRNGYNVTVFSDHMFEMRNWFSNDKIHPYPQKEQVKSTLLAYDLLICLYPHDIIHQAHSWHSNIIMLSESPLLKKKKSIIDVQVDICREELHLTNLVRVNDLTAPKTQAYKSCDNPSYKQQENPYLAKRKIYFSG